MACNDNAWTSESGKFEDIIQLFKIYRQSPRIKLANVLKRDVLIVY